MRLTIVTIGTRGDVQPYIALAKGFEEQGFTVTIAATLDFKEFVESWGIRFRPIHFNLKELLQSNAGQIMMNSSRKFILFLKEFKEMTVPIVDQVMTDLWSICGDSDLIIYSVLAFPCYYITKELGIPSIPSCLQPLARTSQFPSVMIPPKYGVHPLINRQSHQIVEQLFWQCVRPFINKWNKTNSHLKVPFWGYFKELFSSNTPILCGFSESVVPRPKDWAENIHQTGYWFLDRRSDWKPSEDLFEFLKAGKPPVCIGFGSMDDPHLEETLTETLKLLKTIGHRGIFLTGWSHIRSSDFPPDDDVFVTNAVPHDWLFPQVSAVVHHGGAGTTAAAIRAGVPSVIFPFFFDQAFWGHQVHQLGVGVKPLSRRKFSADHLKKAIEQVTSDSKVLSHSQKLKMDLAKENGVGNAIEIVQKSL